MVRLIVILFTLISIVGYSQTDYVIYKVRAGAFDGNTRKFDLKETHRAAMQIRIANDTMRVSDYANSYYLLLESTQEQNTQSLSVISYRSVDERGRKCTIFHRISKTIEHSSFVIVYSNYIIQYFIAHTAK